MGLWPLCRSLADRRRRLHAAEEEDIDLKQPGRPAEKLDQPMFNLVMDLYPKKLFPWARSSPPLLRGFHNAAESL